MAGRGPAPKLNAHRRRGGDAATDELPVEGYAGPVPALPATYSVSDGHNLVDVAFLSGTCEWYGRWARSPMASRFTDVEWDRLRLVIAPLFDRYLRTSARDLAAELRLQEASLGGTAMDRARMRVRIAEPSGRHGAPHADVRRLRAVDPNEAA